MLKCVKIAIAAALAVVMLLPLAPIPSGAAATGDDKIIVVLDPGHGGYDPGASGNGVVEDTWSLSVAREIKAILEENGNFIVYMTRNSDTYVSIGQRGVIANNYNADLLFSIHFDASESSSWRGASFITSVFDEHAATTLGNMVLKSLSSNVGLSNRGLIRRKDNAGYYWNAEKQWDCQDPSLGVLSDYYGIPTWGAKFGYKGVIVEHGFVSSKADTDLLKAAGYNGIAQADAQAIIDYYTNHTHTYGAATVDFPSNCSFVGKKSEKCTVCGHRKNVTELAPDPENHYWINENSKKATCGEDGYVYHECRITLNLNQKGVEVANHKENKVIKAEPHNYELVDSKEVTHAEDGYSKYKCTKCGDTYTDTVKCEGHSWYVTEEVKPTCTKAGKTVRACRGCDEIKTEEQKALGHNMKYTVTREPTCTEAGERTGKCSTCGETETEIIKATGHSLEEKILTEPSCEEKGAGEKACTSCDYKEEFEIDALGHDKGEDGVCKTCGTVLETTPPETDPPAESTPDVNEPLQVQPVKDAETAALKKDEDNKKSEPLAIVLIAVAAGLAVLFIVVRIVLASKAKKGDDADDGQPDAEEEAPAEEKEETEVL